MGIPLAFWREKLEGHETSQPSVLGLIHHPISSSAKLLDNVVSRCRRRAIGRCSWVLHSRRILGVSMRASQSRGFFLFPRGLGSREEFCEAVTGLQLGIHQKRMSYLQSSICNPGTRANSLVLLVTTLAPKPSDWAAMKVSKERIAVPAFSRTVPTLTYISATVWSIGRHQRVRGWLRANVVPAHAGE